MPLGRHEALISQQLQEPARIGSTTASRHCPSPFNSDRVTADPGAGAFHSASASLVLTTHCSGSATRSGSPTGSASATGSRNYSHGISADGESDWQASSGSGSRSGFGSGLTPADLLELTQGSPAAVATATCKERGMGRSGTLGLDTDMSPVQHGRVGVLQLDIEGVRRTSDAITTASSSSNSSSSSYSLHPAGHPDAGLMTADEYEHRSHANAVDWGNELTMRHRLRVGHHAGRVPAPVLGLTRDMDNDRHRTSTSSRSSSPDLDRATRNDDDAEDELLGNTNDGGATTSTRGRGRYSNSSNSEGPPILLTRPRPRVRTKRRLRRQGIHEGGEGRGNPTDRSAN